MRILHLFDQLMLDDSEYSLRNCAIVKEQQNQGLITEQLVIDSGDLDRALEVSVENPADSSDSVNNDKVPPGVRYFQVDGIKFKYLDLSGLFFNIPILKYCRDFFQLRWGLRKLIEQFDPHVIHAHSPAIVGLAALQLGGAKQIPVVYELRAYANDSESTANSNKFANQLYQKLESHVIRHAKAITVSSDGLRQEALQRGVSEENIALVPQGASVADELPTRDEEAKQSAKDFKRELGLEGKILLGYVGAFKPHEGLHLILQALPILLQGLPDLHLLLVGGGDEEANLKQMASQLGLSGQVTFSGKCINENLDQYLNIIDVLVFPRLSTPFTEKVEPLFPLHALANGNVILASDVGGHHQIIRHGDTGYLFKKDDKNALADTVVDVLNERAAWPFIRERGKSYIKKERDWSNSVSIYKQLYSKLAVHEDA